MEVILCAVAGRASLNIRTYRIPKLSGLPSAVACLRISLRFGVVNTVGGDQSGAEGEEDQKVPGRHRGEYGRMMIIAPLERVITIILRVGRSVAWVAIGLMVVVTLLQVVMRYVFNNALAWPDEAARFMMLWMTGLIAPSAYRWGGFVAIDMVKDAMPRLLALLLNLSILIVSLAVLVIALQLGWKHVNSGWLFNSSSLRIPLDLVGGESIRVKLAYMYMSIFVGICLMTLVNVEMILKNLHMLIDPDADYSKVPDQIVMSAE